MRLRWRQWVWIETISTFFVEHIQNSPPDASCRYLRASLAREIFARKPSVKKHLWGGEFWTDGYYVATVGERADWRTVEKDVQKQGLPKQDLKQLPLFGF